MYFYQLESKEADRAFLQKEIIKCAAVISDISLSALTPGNKIVIQLSNKSKYMATVIDTEFSIVDAHAHGFLYLKKL
jgi:hypothetical protein